VVNSVAAAECGARGTLRIDPLSLRRGSTRPLRPPTPLEANRHLRAPWQPPKSPEIGSGEPSGPERRKRQRGRPECPCSPQFGESATMRDGGERRGASRGAFEGCVGIHHIGPSNQLYGIPHSRLKAQKGQSVARSPSSPQGARAEPRQWVGSGPTILPTVISKTIPKEATIRGNPL
jgi:hypothetical protein